MPYEINHEKFADGPSLVELYQSAREAPMPKLNVKIRTSDLRIIDSIAKQSGTPRSQILNAVIESITRKVLKDLADDDLDCAVLLAQHADSISGVSFRTRGGWTDAVFDGQELPFQQYFDLDLPDRQKDSFSDQFRVLAERFAKAKS